MSNEESDYTMNEKKKELIQREIDDMSYKQLSQAVDQMEFGGSDIGYTLSQQLSHISYRDGEHFSPPTSEEIDEVIYETWDKKHDKLERKRSREESPAYDERCGHGRHWVKSHRRNGVEIRGHCAKNP